MVILDLQITGYSGLKEVYLTHPIPSQRVQCRSIVGIVPVGVIISSPRILVGEAKVAIPALQIIDLLDLRVTSMTLCDLRLKVLFPYIVGMIQIEETISRQPTAGGAV